MVFGEGDYRYEEVDDWAKLPEGWVFTQVSDAAVDSQGRIYAFTRGVHPVIVFDKAGNFITSWGYGDFGISPNLISQSHGIFIDPEDKVFLTDSYQHIVRRYTRLGELEREWGNRGVPSPAFRRGEYNMPTGVAFAPDGESFYVSDGYANMLVHKYSRTGEHLATWGEAGHGPGQFSLVHNIGCDKTGRVLVCDRENSRIQVFDPEGKFIEAWTDLMMPGDVWITDDNAIYVAEQGGGGRVSVWSPDGELICRFADPSAVQSPHGLCVDDEGSIYVAEIGTEGQGQRLQKFARVR